MLRSLVWCGVVSARPRECSERAGTASQSLTSLFSRRFTLFSLPTQLSNNPTNYCLIKGI